jgi:hypothetical protein
MNLKTRYLLWRTKRQLAASDRLKKALWKKLDARWAEKHPVSLPWYQTGLLRLASTVTAGAVLAGSVTTGAYAYASPEVTDGSVLYPVKQALETVEEKIKLTPEAKAQFYLKQIARRQAEATVIEAKTKATGISPGPRALLATPTIEDKIEQVELKLEATEEVLVSSTPKNLALQARIKDQLEKRKNRLEQRRSFLQARIVPKATKPFVPSVGVITVPSADEPPDEVRPVRGEAEASTTPDGHQVIIRRIDLLNKKLENVSSILEAARGFIAASGTPARPVQNLEGVKVNLEERLELLNNKLEE